VQFAKSDVGVDARRVGGAYAESYRAIGRSGEGIETENAADCVFVPPAAFAGRASARP
jgi:hypothetical protein